MLIWAFAGALFAWLIGIAIGVLAKQDNERYQQPEVGQDDGARE